LNAAPRPRARPKVWQDAEIDDLGEARYAELDFNAPMSSGRVRELAASLQPLSGASIVDLGC
jgi:hypothetical protein